MRMKTFLELFLILNTILLAVYLFGVVSAFVYHWEVDPAIFYPANWRPWGRVFCWIVWLYFGLFYPLWGSYYNRRIKQ